MDETLRSLLGTVLLLLLGCALIALIGLFLLMRHVRSLGIPRNADFFTTMRYVPLRLVLLLDLLDFGLDIFSAPISWLLLDRMGLPGLRNKVAIEALIPFTGPIPTFTVAWFATRALHLDQRNDTASQSYRLPDLRDRR